MFLEYLKDGKKIECRPLYGRTKVGQIVVLTFVTFGENHPLAKYQQPAIFHVAAEHVGGHTLRDEQGGLVQVSSSDRAYLFDIHEWIEWNRGREEEHTARKNSRIKQLEGYVDLLRDILIKQGFRVVSMDQAKSLGITP